MSNSYLDQLIQIVSSTPFQAAYVPTPIDNKPTLGCELPTLVAPPSPLGSVTQPTNTKACNPLFIAQPIVPELFALPENCPNGISVSNQTVNIFAQISDVAINNPAGTVTIGASPGDSICDLQLNIPPIVIPCFPIGPQLSSSAGVTVVDPNQGTVVTTPITLDKSPDAACNWQLNGPIEIVLPRVPCPGGISIKSASFNIKTSPTSPVVDKAIMSISKDNSDPCSYDITLPVLTIPCYPNGPSVTGGVTIVVTDSVAGSGATVTHNADFNTSNSTPCLFTLDSNPINIDIPCSKNGIQAIFSNLIITDPFRSSPTGSSLVTIVEKPDLCTLGVTLPTLSIPCYPDGLKFSSPIVFTALDFVTNTPVTAATINLTDDEIPVSGGSPIPSLRDPSAPCHWSGATIKLPGPLCDGGFILDASNFTVKLNNSNTLPNTTPDNPSNFNRYNSLTFQKSSNVVDSATQCQFELVGELNLGLPALAACASLTLASVPLTITTGLTNEQKVTQGQVEIHPITTCEYQFTSTNINIPALVCDTYTLNPTTFTAGPQAGQSIGLTVKSGNTIIPQSGVTLVSADPNKPYCSLALHGQLDLSGIGGGGGGTGNGIGSLQWSATGNYTNGSSVLLTFPEGGVGSYVATSNTLGTPSTPSSNWAEQYIANPGSTFPGFTIIKCLETTTTSQLQTVNPAWVNTDSTDNLKVVPASHLYKSETVTDRYHVFGLDTPFKLSPGQIIYLEVVTIPSNTFGETSVLYAAVCRGTQKDFDVGPSSNSSYIPATTTIYKTLTPTQATNMDTVVANGSLTYCTQSVSQIIGIDTPTSLDLIQLQKAAITAIKNKGTSDTTPYQFKSYIIIAQAEANVTVTGTLSDNSVINKSLGSNLSLTNTNNTSFSVKQIVKYHLAVSAANAGTLPLKILVPAVATVVPGQIAADPSTSNPNITKVIGPAPANLVSFTFNYSTPPNSALLTYVTNEISQLLPSYTPQGLVNSQLQIGVTSDNIHIYYTLDGSVPTVNNTANVKSLKYDPTNPPSSLTPANISLISWMAVYSEFSTAPYRSIHKSD